MTARRRSPRPRPVVLLTVVALAVALCVAGAVRYLLTAGGDEPEPVAVEPVRTNYCTATPSTVGLTELDPEQAGNAAIITGVADRRGLPLRAAAIAIATAMQESRLVNLDHGDADSLGLFQQRPSQGWGTRRQITDPVYAAGAFYDALVRVPGYRTMPITKAAQTVQRSAFPDAYAPYGPSAELIAAALTGRTRGRFTCVLPGLPAPTGSPSPSSATTAPGASAAGSPTGRATALRRAAARETGARRWHVVSPATVRFTVAGSPGDRRAWALATWAVARADDLGITEIQVADRVWSRSRSADGWTTAGRTRGVLVSVS